MSQYDCNVAHVVYASDDAFAWILGVSLVSLYENSRDMKEINVYILDGGIKEENRKKLEKISHNYSRSLPIWIESKDISRELSMKVTMDRGSMSQYARLFLSDSLPSDLSRVLYLDCDTIFLQSVRELWNLDLHGKTIGALMDAFSKYYRANIDLGPEDIMFNSGVMLVDLKKWKEKNVEERLMKFIRMKKGKIQQGDQGALNAILSHDTYCFEPRFNSVTIFYDFSYKEMLIYRKPPVFYSEQQVKEAVENPVIVHFTTSFLSRRPWVKGCAHRYVGEWMRYKELGPWKEVELCKDGKSGWKNTGMIIYKLLPKCIAVRLAGVMQVYVRPIRNKWLQ